MLLNKHNMEAVFMNLKTTFNQHFDIAPSDWQKIAMLVPSSGSENVYPWIGDFPMMRRWIDEKVVKGLEAYKYSIVNEDWEVTIGVKRKDVEDDNLGIYAPQARMAGWSAKQLPDEIIFTLVNNSFAGACYDGQYFIDTDHPVGTGTVSNKSTAALSISTLALAMSSYGALRIAMMSQKDSFGRPLVVTPNVLLVPPALTDVANALLTTDRLEDGKPNPYKGTATLIVAPRLTSTTAWFLVDTSKPVKPFIYQERKAPQFVQQTTMENDDVFMRGVFKFGAEARAAGGYGFWQLCFGSTGAGS